MSGVDHYQKRKRKRKTRAERNQVSLHLLEQKKQKRFSNYLKDMNPCQNTVYTLRSGRGSSHPAMVSRDDMKTTTASITHGRLTRSLGKLGFPNGKVSDWIRRGPISESEDMKKKVESDIKRILRLAEKSTLTGNSDLGACCLPDSGHKDETAQTTSEPAQDVMEVDCTSHNPPAVDKTVSETSDQQIMEAGAATTTGTATTSLTSTMTGTATTAAATDQAEATSTKSADSAVWFSESSNNADEVLELEPPVQDIADTILKELKPKFARMFPNRDIEVEVCSDLQKLLNHSCCHTEEIPVSSVSDFFLPPEYQEPVNVCTPGLGIPATSMSTLSICRQPRKFETRRLYPQLPHIGDTRLDTNSSMLIQESVFFPCVSTDSSTNFHQGGDASSSSFTATFVMQDLPEAEDVMKINVNVDESEDEDSDILSTARYNAFLASARELELQQGRVLHGGSTFDGVTTSQSSSYHHCSDHHPLLQRPHELRRDNSYKHFSNDPDPSCWPFDWRNVRAARVLDFSQPNGDNPHQTASFSCLSRRFNETLYPDIHLCHSRMNHSSSQLDSLFNSTACDQSQFSFGSQRCSLPGVDPNNLDKRWSYPEVFLSPVDHSTIKSTAPTIGPCLAQSRLKFENAVKFACQPHDVTYVKPPEHMDTEGCSDFLASIHGRSSPLQAHDFLASKNLMMRPLSELQNHQADLQRQARDFLDDLNRCGVKPHHDCVNHQSTSSARHLLQIASPGSSGSPVWGVPSVITDFGMDTGSFA